MASPQKENGHIDIANELSCALMLLKINGVQSRLLWVILRKTYGWHKKKDHISLSQFSRLTNLPPKLISRELIRLEKRNIIKVEKSMGKTNFYSFQKDYEQWGNYLPISRQLIHELSTNQRIGLSTNQTTTIPQLVDRTIYQLVDELSTNQGNTKEIKETIKETIQKKGYIDIYGDIFTHWNAQSIIIHYKITKKIMRAIDGRLDEGYTVNKINESVSNYALIVKDPIYYFKYKWTLQDFLSRGIDKFADLEIAKQNYRKEQSDGKRRSPDKGMLKGDPDRFAEIDRKLGITG